MDTTEIEGGERIDLPDGSRVWYFDEDHSYWLCKEDGGRGKRLSGVTTVISPFDSDYSSKQNLLKWAARTNGIGVAQLAAEGLSLEDVEDMRSALGWLGSADSIWTELEEAKLTFEDVRDKASKRGTNVHEMALAELGRGRPVPKFEGMTPEEIGYAKAVAAFWLDKSPDPDAVEQVVFSPEMFVAGRLDFLGGLGTREGRGVIDAKTSGFIGVKDHVQVAGYRMIAKECGFGDTDWGYILQLREDGTYRLIESVATPEQFKLGLDTYRAAGKIKREAKDAWARASVGGQG